MNLEAMEKAARQVWGDALQRLGFSYERAQLALELVEGAKHAGYAGYDVRWIASRGLAWSGYGGGL